VAPVVFFRPTRSRPSSPQHRRRSCSSSTRSSWTPRASSRIPGNPKLHRPQCWNQWGAVIEIAPDVKTEVPGADVCTETNIVNASVRALAAVGPASCQSAFLPVVQERNAAHRQNPIRAPKPSIKPAGTTIPGRMTSAPTLVMKNQGNTSQYYHALGPHRQSSRACRGAPSQAGPPRCPAAILTWNIPVRRWCAIGNSCLFPRPKSLPGCDIHQVPPTGAARGADFMYDVLHQTQKRISTDPCGVSIKGLRQAPIEPFCEMRYQRTHAAQKFAPISNSGRVIASSTTVHL